MTKYDFEMEQEVVINLSGHIGRVIGRAEYVDAKQNYYVEFVNGNGNAVTEWFVARELTAR
jgi:hypothetical protein